MEAADITLRHRKCASPQVEVSAHRAPQAAATVHPEVKRAAPQAVARAATPVVAAIAAAEAITGNDQVSSHRVRSPFSVGPGPFFWSSVEAEFVDPVEASVGQSK